MSSIFEALQRARQENPPVDLPVSAHDNSSRKVFVSVLTAVLITAGVMAVVFIVFGSRGDRASVPGPGLKLSADPSHHDVSSQVNARHSKEARNSPGHDAQKNPLTETPEDVEAYLQLGAGFYEMGDYENALITYTKAHRFYKTDARLLNNIGTVLLAQGKMEKAVDYFEQSHSLSGDYVEPVYNMACAYARMKKRDAALEALRTAAAMHPDVSLWANEDSDFASLTGDREFEAILGRH
ncbi:MAG: tetratricopeptide repeat protein [Desulfomonilia bacterium]